MATIENHGPRLSEMDISRLEMRLGLAIPEEYRRFLLTFNGGSPEPDTLEVERLPGRFADVQVFFGIGRAVESSNVDWNLAVLADRLRTGLLPIACDSSGSVFCVALQGDDRGVIFYCDLQSVYGNLDVGPTLYPVASSFDAFLKKLQSFPAT